MLAHLLVAGPVEGALTGGVLAYLQRANIPLLKVNHQDVPVAGDAERRTGKVRPMVVAVGAVGIMTLLTPLGLLAPGGAFGESAPKDLNLSKLGLSAVPEGLSKYTGLWRHAIFHGYDFGGANPWLGYLVSALVGILAVGLVVYLIGMAAEAFLKRGSMDKV